MVGFITRREEQDQEAERAMRRAGQGTKTVVLTHENTRSDGVVRMPKRMHGTHVVAVPYGAPGKTCCPGRKRVHELHACERVVDARHGARVWAQEAERRVPADARAPCGPSACRCSTRCQGKGRAAEGN